jgi:hypothetical protein
LRDGLRRYFKDYRRWRNAMQRLNKWLMAGLLLIASYFLWSFFVSSRYQALCQLVYWDSTTSQIRSCDELRTQLETAK